MMVKSVPKHLLVIRLSAMGDAAMTVPVLRAFVIQYPKVRITVLTRPLFKPFFRDLQNVTVFPADLKGEHKGIFGLLRLSKQIRAVGVDAIADLHNVLRSKILKFLLSDIKSAQIDKGREEKKALTSGQIFEPLKTTHQRYQEVFEQLGFPLEDIEPTFPAPAVLNSKTQSIVGTKAHSLIGIAPFAAHSGKMYPLELMEQVIKTLAQHNKILLFGGREDTAYLNSLEKINVTNVAGKLTMDEELDLISNLDLMIAMDSGNAHMAAMLGVRVLTLWGVTHPYAGFYPFHQDPNNALLASRENFPKIPTSVYGNNYPGGYENCMASIAPASVVSKAEELIKKTPLK